VPLASASRLQRIHLLCFDHRFFQSASRAALAAALREIGAPFGEPLSQRECAVAPPVAAKHAGIRTALEKCGYRTTSDSGRLVSITDLFLFDLKAAQGCGHGRRQALQRPESDRPIADGGPIGVGYSDGGGEQERGGPPNPRGHLLAWPSR
jgi:hypothetical protein